MTNLTRFCYRNFRQVVTLMIVFGQLIKAASCHFRARTKHMEIDAGGAELRRKQEGRFGQSTCGCTVGGFGGMQIHWKPTSIISAYLRYDKMCSFANLRTQ